jgi:predicted amidohydrolase
MICNDRWNPDVARTQVMDGAQILLIPAYGSRRRHQNEAVIARARENGVPIVEANVGVNLIVSKGEVVAYAWGNDRISLAEIEAPLPPSSKRARSMEEAFLTWQEPEMQRRHEKTVEHSSSETAI